MPSLVFSGILLFSLLLASLLEVTCGTNHAGTIYQRPQGNCHNCTQAKKMIVNSMVENNESLKKCCHCIKHIPNEASWHFLKEICQYKDRRSTHGRENVRQLSKHAHMPIRNHKTPFLFQTVETGTGEGLLAIIQRSKRDTSSFITGPALRFSNHSYYATIFENAAPSTVVIQLKAKLVDKDGIIESTVKGKVVYDMDGEEHSAFAMDHNTGLITVKDSKLLDYETSPRIRIAVMATSGKLYDFATVWVSLKDVNDNAPIFPRDKYNSAVYEGLPRGSFVTQVTATDADSGLNGRIVYKIVSGNINNSFAIDPPNTGIVSTNCILDREAKDFYRLEILALDQGGAQRTGTTVLRIQVVDVNDNVPEFIGSKEFYVREGIEIGMTVAQMSARDADVNSTFIFTIVNETKYFTMNKSHGNVTKIKNFESGSRTKSYFSVDKYSGQIVITEQLDREFIDRHVLIIQVSDGLHRSETEVNIFVMDDNDNAPAFVQSTYNVSVNELTQADTLVAVIEARDDDDGVSGAVQYELIGSDLFRINKTTGAIYTNRLVTLAQSSRVIDVVVKAVDGGMPPMSSVIPVKFYVVDVNNHPPVFMSSSYSFQIPEDRKVDSRPVFIFLALDEDLEDVNTQVFYSTCKTSNQPDEDSRQYDVRQYFYLNESTGELFLIKPLDREEKCFYHMIVKVSNHGDGEYDDENCADYYEMVTQVNSKLKKNKNKRTKTTLKPTTVQSLFNPMYSYAFVNITILDINDHKPRFSNETYQLSLDEDCPIDALVLHLAATDPDLNDNGKVSFSIVGGNENGTFHLHPNTGMLTLRSRLDYEMRSHYRLLIEAKDGGVISLSSHCSVEINVRDVNEFRPVFPTILYIATINDVKPAGSLIFTAQATDRDSGLYGMIRYRLILLSEIFEAPLLRIDPISGEVRVQSTISRHGHRRLTLNYLVVAEDAGGLNATVNAVVTVEPDVNQKIRFNNSSYAYHLAGDARAGFVFGRVSIIGMDDKDNEDDGDDDDDDDDDQKDVEKNPSIRSVVNYSLLENSWVFAINRTTGELYLLEDLRTVSFERMGITSTDSDNSDDDDGFRKSGHNFGKVKRDSKDEKNLDLFHRERTARRDLHVGSIKAGNVVSRSQKRVRITRKRSVFESVQLTLVAEWEFPESGKAMAELKIDIDRACDGCSMEAAYDRRFRDSFLTKTHLIMLLAFLLGIFFVVATIALATLFRQRRRCKPEKVAVVMDIDHTTFKCSSMDTTVEVPSPPPYLKDSCLNNRSPHHSISRLSRTDEEIRLINNSFSPLGDDYDDNDKDSHDEVDADMINMLKSYPKTDEGITNCNNIIENKDFCKQGVNKDDEQNQEEKMSGEAFESFNKTSEVCGLLGKQNELFLDDQVVSSAPSMESIHLFSEEGGGESDWLRAKTPMPSKNYFHFLFHSGNLSSENLARCKDGFFPPYILNGYKVAQTTEEDIKNSPQQHSFSSKLFKMIGWLPDYSSLSEVYEEIAKLKDDKISIKLPKIQPTKILVAPILTPINLNIKNEIVTGNLPRFYPPPILTDAPPVKKSVFGRKSYYGDSEVDVDAQNDLKFVKRCQSKNFVRCLNLIPANSTKRQY